MLLNRSVPWAHLAQAVLDSLRAGGLVHLEREQHEGLPRARAADVREQVAVREVQHLAPVAAEQGGRRRARLGSRE